MKKCIKAMLVEDQAAYREVITLALKSEEDIELVSQFSSVEFALREIQNPASRKRPDLVLLDLNLPGMSGIEAIPWFREYAPEIKIIILTQSEAEADVMQAIRNGASGYLLKSASATEVRDAIRTAMEGGAPLDPGVARFMLDTLKHNMPDNPQDSPLSDRELEVLTLLAEGRSKKEISSQLGISENTVIYHAKHVYEKLDAANAPAAVSKAYQSGILSAKKKS